MMLKMSAGFTGRAVTRTSTSPAAHFGTSACSHFSVEVGFAGSNAVTTTRCMLAGAMSERSWEGSGCKRAYCTATRRGDVLSCTGISTESRAPGCRRWHAAVAARSARATALPASTHDEVFGIQHGAVCHATPLRSRFVLTRCWAFLRSVQFNDGSGALRRRLRVLRRGAARSIPATPAAA